jgi:hypothetical protein
MEVMCMEDKSFDLLTKMYSEFTEFRTETKQRFNYIEDHLIILENKQSDDSRILYDAYKNTYENIVEIKEDINEIKKAVGVHEVKLLKVK